MERVRQKLEQHCKGGIPGRSQAYLRRGCFTCPGQHVPGRDHDCALRVGVQPSLLQEPLISQTCRIPASFSSPGPERHSHCQRGDAYYILPTPRERLPAAAGVSSGEMMLCPFQGFLQAVIFMNWETFPPWTGNSLSFALFFGWFCRQREGGKGEAEGLFFFLQEEQLRQACLKLKWQHKGA